MKGRRKVALLIGICLIVGVGLALLFGLRWERQWDTKSGKSRTNQTIWGLSYSDGPPEPTVLSRWLDDRSEDENWIAVAVASNRAMTETHADDQLEQYLELIEKHLTDEAKHDLAAALLESLESSQNIWEVHYKASRLSPSIFRRTIREAGPLDADAIVELWNQSNKTQQDKPR